MRPFLMAALARPRRSLYPVRAPETELRYSRREDLWFILAARSEDETEVRAYRPYLILMARLLEPFNCM
jgi:hypothetical protein